MKMELAKTIEFTPEQVALIKSQIAPNATNDELNLFMYQAKMAGLNPLARQIYAIHRNVKDGNNWVKKMTIQVSIDGFRLIAERSGSYGGQDEPEFKEDEKGNLIFCKVAVYRFRGEQRYKASVGVAYWKEYCQNDKEGKASGMWGKMPHTMLSKVAEALALRKAYPQDLSGLYTSDEMQQSDTAQQVVEQTKIVTDHEVVNESVNYSKKIEPNKSFDKTETLTVGSTYFTTPTNVGGAPSKLQLTETIFKAMIDAIPKDYQKVIEAMPKYTMTDQQRDELLSAIEFEKKLTTK